MKYTLKQKTFTIILLVVCLGLSVFIVFPILMKDNDSVGMRNGKLSGSVFQTIQLTRTSDAILNPLMGWAPWATAKRIYQPFSLVYVDLTWQDLQPQEGIFDFASFEQKQQLFRWRQEGKRIIFRFVLDIPGDESHMDIPDWLFEKTGGDGDFYDNDYGKGFSPNYSNPLIIKYHHAAVQALGDRYGKDGFFAFIELGSLGHWGEWHEHPGLKQLPSENIRDLYVYDYINAFPGTHLLMRRPFTITRDLDLGLYNDMTGSVEDTSSWLDWIKNGGDYLPNESDTLVPMPDGWQVAPVGGEQAPDLADEQLYDTDLGTTLQLLKDSHASFIGPGGPYDLQQNGPLQKGLDEVMATIGYRLYLDKVEMPLVVQSRGDLETTFSFSNGGIAPFYYEWPTEVYLFDDKETIVATYPLPIDLRKILPNEVVSVSFLLPVDQLENGKYTLGLAIIDPITGLPAVHFANENRRSDLIQEVGSFEVKWLSDSLK